MKRFISIALVSLYLFNLFGYMATFVAAQAQIRREVKARIKQRVPAGDLVLISITPATASSLQWIKSFEFRYRGGLYDIVRVEQRADTTRFFCINDLQEESLFAGLDEHVRRQMESDQRCSRPGLQGGTAGPTEHLPSVPWAGLPTPVFLTPPPPSLLLPPSLIREVPVPPPRVA